MELKVKITKDILQRSMMCGNDVNPTVTNCAVVLAVREIFPNAIIDQSDYAPFPTYGVAFYKKNKRFEHDGIDFIIEFDRLKKTPHKRLNLPETTVTLQLTDEIINAIEIDNWKEVIETSDVLDLVDEEG